MKTIQYNTGQASDETHADGDLRNSHKKRECGETHICTQEGARPPTWAVNPQNGRAKGQRVCTSPPPEETQRPSVLAHANDPAYSSSVHTFKKLSGPIHP